MDSCAGERAGGPVYGRMPAEAAVPTGTGAGGHPSRSQLRLQTSCVVAGTLVRVPVGAHRFQTALGGLDGVL